MKGDPVENKNKETMTTIIAKAHTTTSLTVL